MADNTKTDAKAEVKTEDRQPARVKPLSLPVKVNGIAQRDENDPFRKILTKAGVKPSTWTSKVAALLVKQGGESTITDLADAWEKSGDACPGASGKYHSGGEDHPQKTPQQSFRYGARRAVNELAMKGLVETDKGQVKAKGAFARYIESRSEQGQIEKPARRPVKRTRRTPVSA